MEFLKSWQFMVGFFVVVFGVAASLLAYGITNHSEPGLMPDAVHWGHHPLTVCSQNQNTEMASSDQQDELRYAINTTNQRLGFNMMLDTDDQHGACDVVVTFDVAVGGDGCRDAGGDMNCEGHWCSIRICNTGTAEMTQLALQHELGHAMGLAHDPDNHVSIMQPVLGPTPDGEFPPHISDSDRELLRKLYGGSQ